MAKIIGNTTTTPMAIPDWNQSDPTKADYIKNKPEKTTVIDENSTDEQYVTAKAVYDYISDGSINIGNGGTHIGAEAPRVQINPTTNEWEISTDGGNTYISTGVKATGEDGSDGRDGADGKTPYIKDGNWWIGETDTGVKAEGIDGQDGVKGDKGDTGAQGIQGEKGDTGIGVKSATINTSGELVITYTNDIEVNLGVIVGANGVDGDDYILTDDDKQEIAGIVADSEKIVDAIDVKVATVMDESFEDVLAEAEGHANLANEYQYAASVCATDASTYAGDAWIASNKARRYAVGGTNTEEGEDSDNAKYYCETASSLVEIARQSAENATTKAEEASADASAASQFKADTIEYANSAKADADRAEEAANRAETAVGTPGENGATFTPNVSDEGIISWTNDKGLENPTPVNIKGDDYVLTDADKQEIASIVEDNFATILDELHIYAQTILGSDE